MLCSLLLGFGLDAYIAIGTANNEPHTWVLTRTIKADTRTVEFWETLTSQRIESGSAKALKYYNAISCVFSENKFYANIQSEDTIASITYNFENDAHWKSMDSEYLKKIEPWNYQVSLKILRRDTNKEAEKIEEVIRTCIADYRMNTQRVQTSFDESLSYMLAPALANYEMERVCGFTVGDEEFQSAISRAVPDKHIFKAFPIHVQGLDGKKGFGGIMQSKIGREILNTKGDSIRFAVRAKVIDYPEYITSTWIIIAVRYYSMI